jgi:hypothetical protein
VTSTDVGRTRFQAGMRVAREHLDHMQDVLLTGVAQAREEGGVGKVCHGFRVKSRTASRVRVGPGLAVDAQGRPLALGESRDVEVEFGSPGGRFLVASHALRSYGLVDGVPTLLFDDVSIEARTAAPPYDDDAVVFAQVEPGEGSVRVVQKGEWYLPSLDHGHTGTFVLRQGRVRFDGDPVGFSGPLFDSGFVPVERGGEVRLVHGLKTFDLLVQVQARGPDGVVTSEGLGRAFWYVLVDDQQVALVRDGSGGEMFVRATLWPFGPPGAGPVLPVADAGPALTVEAGEGFTLDAGRSRAFGGRQIVKFVWTELS